MNAWENYSNSNQQTMYRPEYFGAGSDYYKGDNMLPDSFNECVYETKATENLRKWTKVFKICFIVLFIILGIVFFVNAYESSYILVEGENAWSKPTEKFSIGYFIGQLIGYGIIMFAIFLSYILTFAVLNCVAQITRNTGISAKLAAFNTRNQMKKEASKENEDKMQ